jgi:hypothetical protein
MSADNWAVCPKCNKGTDRDALAFREDYEIGMLRDGEFYVYYRGECADCGFKHEFRHEENL